MSLAASPPLRQYEFEQPHMGTLFRIVLYANDDAAARDGAEAAFEQIAGLDARLSDYRPDSEVNRAVREAAKRPIAISAELFDVLRIAQDFGGRTSGAFDVTAGALTHLWRRARRSSELPSVEQIAAAKAVSGFGLVHLNPAARTLRLERTGVLIDFGGIGKGYAADRALDVLRDAGIRRALVVGGGDVAAGDPPPGRQGWDIALAGPDGATSSIVLSEAGVSTSGDLEQWLAVDGVRYSHIIDPRTGNALTERRLVSVVAPDATTSDMLATAASVLGGDEAIELVEGTPGAAVRIGTADAEGRVTWRTSRRWPL